jgi:hypothetical protein
MRPRHFHRRRPGRDLQSVLASIDRTGSAPDQTEVIMDRLGYTRASADTLHRQRRRRVMGRFGMTLVCGVVLAVSIEAYRHGDTLRRPTDTTISGAVRQDLQRQQQRFDKALRTIRNRLGPAATTAPAPGRTDKDVDPAAMAPVRWI